MPFEFPVRDADAELPPGNIAETLRRTGAFPVVPCIRTDLTSSCIIASAKHDFECLNGMKNYTVVDVIQCSVSRTLLRVEYLRSSHWTIASNGSGASQIFLFKRGKMFPINATEPEAKR
jgi:hypothetical protein